MAKRKLIEGYDGARDIQPAFVDSPFGLKGKNGFAYQEAVIRNDRESSLATMKARGQIDDAQMRAGDWFRAKHEAARLSVGAIDPSYEPVDTSGHSDPIPDRVIHAAQALAKARRAIDVGAYAWTLLELVAGEGETLFSAACKRYGVATRMQTIYVGGLFRDALDALAIYLGYASQKMCTQPIDKRTLKRA